jgi:glycosidase
LRTGHPERNRDGCRTPMPWQGGPGAGFTAPDAEPWLPIGDADARNVAAQREDPGSVLHLVRDLIALRRATAALHAGTYESLPAPDGAWVYRRGDDHTVALNLSGAPAAVAGVQGTVAISTSRTRDGAPVGADLVLEPWEGMVVAGS